MAISSVSTWSAPEGLLQSLQRAGISFDLIHGVEGADAGSVLEHVRANANNGEVLEMYRAAMHEEKMCGVVRAKAQVGHGQGEGGMVVVGTVVVCSPGSAIAGFVPSLVSSLAASSSASSTSSSAGGGGSGGAHESEPIGGILAPVVAPSAAHANLVLQGLALMGLRQNKAHKAVRSVLSWVQEEAYEPLLAMGFEVLQAFEEFTNSPDNVSTRDLLLWGEMVLTCL